jgi:hypothetical protein
VLRHFGSIEQAPGRVLFFYLGSHYTARTVKSVFKMRFIPLNIG